MSTSGDEAWIHDDASRVVRPYAWTAGRTEPAHRLDLVSLVRATGSPPTERLEPEHAQTLALCRDMAVSVAEIAATLGQPVQVVKVLLSDLIGAGAVTTRPSPSTADHLNPSLLEKLLDGLQQRL